METNHETDDQESSVLDLQMNVPDFGLITPAMIYCWFGPQFKIH